MKTKWTIITAITAACVVTAVFGVSTMANASSAPLSESVNGTLQASGTSTGELTVTLDQVSRTLPLASTVWISLNGQKAQLSDLKPGDKLEIILNQKDQAAFIKATSAVAVPAGTAAPQQTAVPSPSAASAPATASAAATATPAPTPTAAPAASAPTADEPKMLDIKIEGPGFRLMMKHNPGQDGDNTRLLIKAEGSGTVHLKGKEAEEWIADLLQAAVFKDEASKQQLLQLVALQYGLEASKLKADVKVKWADQPLEKTAVTATPSAAASTASGTVPQPTPMVQPKDSGEDDDKRTEEDGGKSKPDGDRIKPEDHGKDAAKKPQGPGNGHAYGKEKDKEKDKDNKGKND
ncbi:hypothetical protein [Gorillibacterium sp. sgz5001074]|uniref:hypothetical protein n=1 Tax=Gorillibacterium sp. sgz5001074 TaxID=3446695 RepID=UPI003F66FED0